MGKISPNSTIKIKKKKTSIYFMVFERANYSLFYVFRDLVLGTGKLLVSPWT